ncbi:GNAT family N-acetyltransferase [Sporolactobacillus sp. THM19-2]|uniref:GNAT family N-acetyltransferase n=1 Tax=Sporolactobacillus sp. THM19-2 TaxID=2511171 RepID=UPI0010217F05|nr:GNAT family protein [Sporolactobacillus sp. THM19-2]RYL86860.1 N-acetyltransferase [Sporolactobacillus sp. THM19-2]
MNDQEANIIAIWHYEEPYSFYDFKNDEENLEELLNAKARKGVYFSAYTGQELVGFFCFDRKEDTVEIGLGLRPDLTGKGTGIEFVSAGLLFAHKKFGPRKFLLDVAVFNQRAIQVYQHAGFEIEGTMMVKTNGDEFEFYQMKKDVN